MTASPPWLAVLHAAAGFLALGAAALAILARKAGPLHRLAGRVYVLAMTVVFASATMLAIDRGDLTLLAIAIFSYYLVLSGYRALYVNRREAGFDFRFRAGALDKGAAQFTLIASSAMLAYGATQWAAEPRAPALVLFGAIGAVLTLLDLRRFRRTVPGGNGWLFAHMTRMLAGTIAAVTAFLVQNAGALPPLLRWIGPTVVGSALIGLLVAYWRRRLAGGLPPETRIDRADPAEEA